jgi:UTP:GlnB (protein PII) uridylyltransferase
MNGLNSCFLITLIMAIAIVLAAKVQIQSEQIATFDSTVLDKVYIQKLITFESR